jgi:hypothetical protein
MQAGQIKNCIFVTGHLVCPELQTITVRLNNFLI